MDSRIDSIEKQILIHVMLILIAMDEWHIHSGIGSTKKTWRFYNLSAPIAATLPCTHFTKWRTVVGNCELVPIEQYKTKLTRIRITAEIDKMFSNNEWR